MPHLIGLLHPYFSSLDYISKRTAYLHGIFTDEMTKKLNCHQKQQELKFFMHQNSLTAPSLPNKSFSVANESCSGCKQYPTHFHRQRSTSSDSPHETKSQTINQTALTIRNGSKTTPGFNLRRADGNFRLWW